MIYLIAYSNPESQLPEAAAKSVKSKIQLGNQPVWFVETDADSDELLEWIWPDGKEEQSPTGPGVIVPVKMYSAYAPNRLLDWLKANVK